MEVSAEKLVQKKNLDYKVLWKKVIFFYFKEDKIGDSINVH